MNENEKICPLCIDSCEVIPTQGRDGYTFLCDTCGKFAISRTLYSSIPEVVLNNRWLLSGFIRNRPENKNLILLRGRSDENEFRIYLDWKNNSNIFELHTGNIKDILDIARNESPYNPIDQLNRLVMIMSEYLLDPADSIKLLDNFYPILYCHSKEHFEWVKKQAIELGLIDQGRQGLHFLTVKGWERAIELKRGSRFSNQAFIASWFDESMDEPIRDGIISALEKFGFTIKWMKTHQHNNSIDDEIIANIRRSSLMIADFTGFRSGVFYEAGYASGLGIPVIYTCKLDCQDEVSKHFDTRQYNHIFWTDSKDLNRQLINRIAATIPNPPKTPETISI